MCESGDQQQFTCIVHYGLTTIFIHIFDIESIFCIFFSSFFLISYNIQISSLTSSPDSSPSPIAIALGQVSAASGSTTTTLAAAASNNNTAGNGHDNINMTGANSNWCVSFSRMNYF